MASKLADRVSDSGIDCSRRHHQRAECDRLADASSVVSEVFLFQRVVKQILPHRLSAFKDVVTVRHQKSCMPTRHHADNQKHVKNANTKITMPISFASLLSFLLYLILTVKE
jgi:hypothetical protein